MIYIKESYCTLIKWDKINLFQLFGPSITRFNYLILPLKCLNGRPFHNYAKFLDLSMDKFQLQNIQKLNIDIINIQRMSSHSSKSPSRERSRSKQRTQKNKMFVTNLDGTVKAIQEDLKGELTQLFAKYGTIKQLSVKKSKNGEYSFAFVEYEPGEDAEEAIRKYQHSQQLSLNNYDVRGKAMKVQLQDDSKRRKDSDKGCYNCGKKGHFARECRSKNSADYGDRRRRRSRDGSEEYGRRRRNRSDSDSSQRHRSKKDRKNKSKEKKDKSKKKHHKKNRHRSSSGSRS